MALARSRLCVVSLGLWARESRVQSPRLNPITPWEEMFSCVPSPAVPGVAFACMFLPGGSADARGCRRAALLRSPLTRRPRAKRGRARRWEPHALRGVGCAWTGAGCHGHDLARSLQVTRHSPARPSWLTCARCFAQVQPGPAGTEQRGRGRLTVRRKGTHRSARRGEVECHSVAVGCQAHAPRCANRSRFRGRRNRALYRVKALRCANRVARGDARCARSCETTFPGNAAGSLITIGSEILAHLHCEESRDGFFPSLSDSLCPSAGWFFISWLS